MARRGGSTNRPSPGGSSSRPMVARPVRYGPVRQKTNFPIGCLYVPLPDGDCPAGRTMPPVRMGMLGAPVPHTAQPHIAWNSHGPRSRRAATCGDRIRLTELKLPVYAACLLPQSCEPPRSEMSLSAQMFSMTCCMPGCETKHVAFRQMSECGSLIKPTNVTDACTSGPSMYEVGTVLV